MRKKIEAYVYVNPTSGNGCRLDIRLPGERRLELNRWLDRPVGELSWMKEGRSSGVHWGTWEVVLYAG
ncbi:MAG: hypothetical protein NXI30_04085 [bacterium]|nr:hypothetical protein [bacterium]